jgi:hypothetical protein
LNVATPSTNRCDIDDEKIGRLVGVWTTFTGAVMVAVPSAMVPSKKLAIPMVTVFG